MNHSEATITHIWSRFHLSWLLCGAAAGIAAGIIMLALAAFVGTGVLGEWSQPMKLLGATFFGPDATYYGPLGMAGLYGLSLHLALSALYGLIFAQLVCEKSRKRNLVILGFVTSFIIWIFGCMLFMPAFDILLAKAMPVRVGLFLHLAFGVSFGLLLSGFRKILLNKN